MPSSTQVTHFRAIVRSPNCLLSHELGFVSEHWSHSETSGALPVAKTVTDALSLVCMEVNSRPLWRELEQI